MSKSIMIQGTMSNAGKSLLTAALCRIFKQDGHSCAPFKSQNMALNSFITREGLEMGRAQVVQAEAAGIEPSVLMNPILLKPTSDSGSQVIINGEPLGNMTAADYYLRKNEFVPIVKNAFQKLSENVEIVVIEGAGSPVELNLAENDIVNMGMARIADAPVVLVGDIDRGGVFAQLLGTVDLLEPSDRERVKALVVNKFRGDKTLFKSGIEILENRSGKRVAGVIPYLNCDIEDEDSLSEKLNKSAAGIIDIAVIKLPRISNFTDFDVFSQFQGVSVRYVSAVEQLKNPDLIIIPGTKSTISDMKFLRESGLEAAIFKANCPIFGICGGYQLLGAEISDPYCSEGGGTIRGMGLLDAKTVFSPNKRMKQVHGKFNIISGFFGCLSGAEFDGYEIHHGITECSENSLTLLEGEIPDGMFCKDVCGSYVHGIFDSKDVCERLVNALYKRRGLEYSGISIDREAYKQQQLDILAKQVRVNLDMDLIYSIVNKKI